MTVYDWLCFVVIVIVTAGFFTPPAVWFLLWKRLKIRWWRFQRHNQARRRLAIHNAAHEGWAHKMDDE
jgi:hypothetical protein